MKHGFGNGRARCPYRAAARWDSEPYLKKSRNCQAVRGNTGLLERLLQFIRSQLLNAAVGKADIALIHMTRSCLISGGVCRKQQQARFDRNTANFKIVVAREKHLRMIQVSVQADEVADVIVIEAS